MRDITVLATSAGNDGFPAVLDALKANGERNIRVLGVDSDEAAAGIRICDKGWTVPSRIAAKELLDQLLSIARAEQVDVLYPLSTEDQEFFALHRSAFESVGIKVVTSSLEALRVSNDKLALLRRATEAGVPCPVFVELTDVSELDALVQHLGFPAQPCVIKLNRGTGSRGVKIIDANIDPTERLFDRMNHRVGLDDVKAGLCHPSMLPPLHLCEYLPGREYSVDVLCNNGKTISSVVRDRKSTLFGMATHAIVVDLPVIDQHARSIVEACGLSYVVNVQFRCREDGTPCLLEINPRIPGTIALSTAAGINMPYLAVKLVLDEPIGPLQKPVFGTQLARYWSTISWE